MIRDLYYLDTETVGLVGPAVLIQYARGGDDVTLFHVWEHTPREVMDLIEEFMDVGYVAFNAAFDHYALQKLYCMCWALSPAQWDKPMPSAEVFQRVERRAVFGPCVKPRVVVDLEAHCRKGPYQKYLSRESAWIFNVPEVLCDTVANDLNSRNDMDQFYFAGVAKEKRGWTVEDKCKSNRAEPGFKHLTLRFKPRLTLKAIHRHLMGGGARETLPIPKEIMPQDKQPKPGKSQKFSWEWMPYAEPVSFGPEGLDRGTTWVSVLEKHVAFWRDTDSHYAENDVHMLRDLDRALGYPVPDFDHTLTAVVASVRFRGYPLDRDGVARTLEECRALVTEVEQELGCSLDKHAQVRKRLLALCDELEAVAITGTNDAVLESLTKWEGHPVAALAKRIQTARTAKKKALLMEKLHHAGRFHPGLRVVGTQTDRMSGANGLNPQGIDHDPATRSLFIMQETSAEIMQYLKERDPHYGSEGYAWFYEMLMDEHSRLGDMRLDGGDFDGFETALVIAIWSEEALSRMVGEGLKAYWIFGSYLFHDVLPRIWRQREAKRLKKELGMVEGSKAAAALVAPSALELIQLSEFKEYASRAKNCWYALVYGAQVRKIAETAGLSIEETEAAYKRMEADLPSMKDSRMSVFETLSVMVNEEEGKGFTLRDTDGVIENLLGHRRDFSREIELIQMIFLTFSRLKVPKYMDRIQIIRREDKGPQKVRGAAISALIGGALRVQARMQRQGTNFQPQSSGSQINKQCQCAIWEEQPVGVHPWLVVPLNVHDEIMASVRGELDVSGKLYAVVEKWRNAVPLINIEWKRGIRSWTDK